VPASYLLDTNTASYIIKGTPAQVRQRMLAIPMVEVALSTITEAELRFGAARRPQLSRINIGVDEFLKAIEILPWDSNAAQEYAILRMTLEKEGKPIGNMDLMIAAHALALDATLVTSDRSFRQIRNLRLEDWMHS
jgi:tRNA(fMet)-specific endonuclease VapC